LACCFACIFNKFLCIHDCLSGNGSGTSIVLPRNTFFMSFGNEVGLLGPAVAAGELVGVKNWSLPGEVGERGGVLMGVLCGDGTGGG
jgi:hypothetical protein